MYICMQNYSFYPKFVHFSEKNFFSAKTSFLVHFSKKYNFFYFSGPNFFGFFYPKFGPNVHFWVQNYIFRVKSTNCFGFRDQMYILSKRFTF